MRLSLAISPCPNDTFMFDALIHHKIDTEGLKFDVVMSDVEELNRKAFESEHDVSKLSFHAISKLKDKYNILNSGAALGTDCGPILISKKNKTDLKISSKIAIPGKYTTAYMLFKIAYPNFKNTYELVFSEIENAILSNSFDAGLIIHENRFTFQEKGLVKLLDLGEFWSQKTNLPIPLGGIAIDKKIDIQIQRKFDRVLKKSIEFAFANSSSSLTFVKSHAQEMDVNVMNSHIKLYVNDYSIDLGEKGREAIKKLYDFCGVDSKAIFVS